MRLLAARRPVKGIAPTGFGTDGDVQRHLDAGFVEHLTRPIRAQMLEAAIHRVTRSIAPRALSP